MLAKRLLNSGLIALTLSTAVVLTNAPVRAQEAARACNLIMRPRDAARAALGLSTPYISYRDRQNQKKLAEILGLGADGLPIVKLHLAEQYQSFQLTPAEASTIKTSKSAELVFERTGVAKRDDFRRAYRDRNFSGAASFIQYFEPGTNKTKFARVVGVRAEGTLDVETTSGGVRGNFQTLSKQTLLAARISSSAAAFFNQAHAAAAAPRVAAIEAPRVSHPFAGQGSKVAQYSSMNKAVFVEAQRTTVAYTLDQRRREDIREMPYSRPQRIEAGRYTFVILDDETLVTGIVRDSLEYGVKHYHLANGRKVVAAGELHVSSNGSYEFNLQSGTFALPMVREKMVTMDQLVARTSVYLEQVFGKAGSFVGSRGLLPSSAVTKESFSQYCRFREFIAVNARACCQLAGLCN